MQLNIKLQTGKTDAQDQWIKVNLIPIQFSCSFWKSQQEYANIEMLRHIKSKY